MKTTLALCVLPLLCACSKQQVYTAIQDNQRFECSKLPEAQAEKCMSQFDTSYEEYEEALQGVDRERR
ncbi:hypothetical protein [Congregibacter litoralis]|uniref:Lipoprotein n=1 Tax=Congregibacter litoralis KT71 TaxID=314285 RepID=A4A3H3_9GAMM|nr:hypothetical protein [Congregibacter litoralis]EAQ99246.2 hypothetical protein KT71_16291 [Congregibacter litoralis KT71]